MTGQGERATEPDWWTRLYAEDHPDAGHGATHDSLDDRFNSAARAVRSPNIVAQRTPSPRRPDTEPAPTRRPAADHPARDAGERGAMSTKDDVPQRDAGSGNTEALDTDAADGTAPDASTPPEPTPAGDGGTGDATPASQPPAAPPPDEATPGVSRPAPPPRSPARSEPERRAAEAKFVGERPPTYEAEPTTLPEADPEGLEDVVADTELEGAQYGALTVRAASLRGDSARFRGRARHEALLTVRFGAGDDALLLLAIAGAGRAGPVGQRPARDACRAIARAVGRSHARLLTDLRAGDRSALGAGLGRLTSHSMGRLRSRAGTLRLAPEEYPADLRCLVLPVDPRCRTRVFFGVGPGGLFLLRDGAWADQEPRPADPPPGDAGPAAHPPFRFRTCVARPGDTLLMASPGLAEPLRTEPEFAAELAARWTDGPVPGLAAFLTDVHLRVEGHADDRTAVTVWEA
ncbi:protein phosphatase 2C domain-containing protein [Streptomyces sp. JJ66]|uniref:protein phosphatase 2C domain-containing protein n=1 Tax=Streptomyces sp. JJ66 TaxID=2803843 RepID=UPI001C5844EC|nr:protein phosphatase 2C domain-containing protein [Streptomyces sp. JJ66]MBW1600655.1 protein phosphatase 2C domain-containing protein [Streptomyces sp. JJ66]